MTAIRVLLLALLALQVQVLSARHAAAELSDTDRDAIRAVIQAQLDAFQRDDAAAAFSYASPSIQVQFENPFNFMAMVKAGYQAVYRPRQVFFRAAVEVNGVVAQELLIIDQDNRSLLALYPMQRQADGSWRINGCYLRRSEEKAL